MHARNNFILQTDTDEFIIDEYSENESEESEDEDSLAMIGENSESEHSSPQLTRPLSAKMQSVQSKLLSASQAVGAPTPTDLPGTGENYFENVEVKELVAEINPEYTNEDPLFEFVTIGSIESKLLAIAGEKMPLIKRSKAQLEALGINPDSESNDGFFHWPENLNSSKLTSMAMPEKEEPMTLADKLNKKKPSPFDPTPSLSASRNQQTGSKVASSVLGYSEPVSPVSKTAAGATPAPIQE